MTTPAHQSAKSRTNETSRTRLSRFAAIFAAGTMLSRVLGLVRDMALAGFATTYTKDAFFLAFRFPNMLRDLVGEGAMNAAFVPLYSETLEKDSREAFRNLVANLMGVMLVVLILLSVLGVLVVPWLLEHVDVLTPVTGGSDMPPDQNARVVSAARWIFPYLFFIGMAVFAMGPLFSIGRYGTASWSPALLNIALIGSLFALSPFFDEPLTALVIGVWLGGIAQLSVLYVSMGRNVGVWVPRFDFRHPGIRRVFYLMGPIMLGQAAGEVNKLVDTFFAASLGVGTITALQYSNRLIQLPLSIFGFATAAAILPVVSGAASRQDFAEVRKSLMYGMRQSFFLVFPAMLGLVFLARPLVEVFFDYREWTAELTAMTASALILYGLGLLSFTWVKVLVTGFYGAQDTRTPVAIAAFSITVNILLNFLLVRSLQYRGLALATTVSYTVNFVLLYVLLGRRFGPLWDRRFLTAIVRMAAAAGLMIALAWVVYLRLPEIGIASEVAARVTRTGLTIAAACISYPLFCMAFRVQEVHEFIRVVARRVKR